MSSGDLADWYKTIPQITRYWFTGCVAIPLAARFGLLQPMWLIMLFEQFFQKFQFWRPVTALFYYPITPKTGFNYLINLYLLYTYSQRLEQTYEGRPADYLFMVIFNWLCVLIISPFGEIYYFMDAMVLSIMYIWCQLNQDVIVNFWFGTQFKAKYLPWVLTGFNMIVRGSVFIELVGIAIGHLYFFLMFKYPQDFNGIQVLRTPEILYKYFPNRTGGVSGFGQAPESRRGNNDDRPNRNVGGRGYVLGDH